MVTEYLTRWSRRAKRYGSQPISLRCCAHMLEPPNPISPPSLPMSPVTSPLIRYALVTPRLSLRASLRSFTYYATRTADDVGSSDIGAIGFNQWSNFVTEYGLMSKSSKFCKRSDCDRMFLAIDSMSARREKDAARLAGPGAEVAASERTKALNRVEWLAALVQMALNKYVLTKVVLDVSDAVSRLLEVDLRSRAKTMHDANDFR